ncbi:MAG TPA: TlpA disulfide reductase family protein [bacterium]|nr:TlpA disulfide reductase family protein [bacterium]HPQ67211.1 TlpA disulfide reductase family protein [bacterium]
MGRFVYWRSAAAAAAVILAAGACGRVPAGRGGGGAEGTQAPGFTLRDLSGKDVSLSDYRGKVVIVDFWATWCPPCRAEMPGFVGLDEKYRKRGLVILAVNVQGENRETVGQFARSLGIDFPILMGTPAVAEAYGGVSAIPTSFVIDREGVIRKRMVGLHPPEEFEKQIEGLLGAP